MKPRAETKRQGLIEYSQIWTGLGLTTRIRAWFHIPFSRSFLHDLFFLSHFLQSCSWSSWSRPEKRRRRKGGRPEWMGARVSGLRRSAPIRQSSVILHIFCMQLDISRWRYAIPGLSFRGRTGRRMRHLDVTLSRSPSDARGLDNKLAGKTCRFPSQPNPRE